MITIGLQMPYCSTQLGALIVWFSEKSNYGTS